MARRFLLSLTMPHEELLLAFISSTVEKGGDIGQLAAKVIDEYTFDFEGVTGKAARFFVELGFGNPVINNFLMCCNELMKIKITLVLMMMIRKMMKRFLTLRSFEGGDGNT